MEWRLVCSGLKGGSEIIELRRSQQKGKIDQMERWRPREVKPFPGVTQLVGVLVEAASSG